MTRVAIYARYSSENQRDASIDDQLRLCREYAIRQDWTCAETFCDRAISGASMLRPGLQGLVETVGRGAIDVVLTEALDRLSRDQADIAFLYRQLSFAGVRIVTLAEGDVSELHIGLKGTMNQLFLKDLADKTRRGLRGRVEAGRSGGGNSFGYEVIRTALPDGTVSTGERKVDPQQAEIVHRIFRDYCAGRSPKAIATALNREAVPGPRGGQWSASTIHGNPQRGTGILNNELYIGRLTWNRLRYVKDPSTGKRVSRPNPATAVIVTEVPGLRILSNDLWISAKARQAASALPRGENRGSALSRANRPRYLFSGMLTCGGCGGGMSMMSATHIGCSAARNKGTCDNRRTIGRAELERRVLGALAARLMDPALFAVFCEEFTDETNRLRRTAAAQVSDQEKDLARVVRDLDRLVQAIVDGTPARSLREKIAELEARRENLESALANREAPAPVLHPAMAEVYRRKVADLAEALNDEATRPEAAEILRGLIDAIELRPGPSRYDILLRGDLAGILTLATNSQKPATLSRDGLSQVALVAGVGFEPTTFRL